MWRQQVIADDAVDGAVSKDKQRENSQADSGFLSASNLISSESSIFPEDEEGPSKEEIKIAPEPAKASESGLDLGLTTDLSRLSLKEASVTQLDSGNIDAVSEDSITGEDESGEIESEEIKESDNVKSENVQPNLEPWQIYYSQDDEGDTPLHISIIQEFTEAAFYLIHIAVHPCLLDILNDDVQTPLHIAVLTSQAKIVRKLIIAGADPTIRDIRGNTPLHLACAAGNLDCVKALTVPFLPSEQKHSRAGQKAPPLSHHLNLRNYDGETSLHIATKRASVELIQQLLRSGADLEAREGLAGYTALHIAVERGQRELARFLVRDCRAKLETRNYAGRTAVSLARRWDPEFAQELLRLGARPSLPPELFSESESSGEEDEGSSDDELDELLDDQSEEDKLKAYRLLMDHVVGASKPIVAR